MEAIIYRDTANFWAKHIRLSFPEFVQSVALCSIVGYSKSQYANQLSKFSEASVSLYLLSFFFEIFFFVCVQNNIVCVELFVSN